MSKNPTVKRLLWAKLFILKKWIQRVRILNHSNLNSFLRNLPAYLKSSRDRFSFERGGELFPSVSRDGLKLKTIEFIRARHVWLPVISELRYFCISNRLFKSPSCTGKQEVLLQVHREARIAIAVAQESKMTNRGHFTYKNAYNATSFPLVTFVVSTNTIKQNARSGSRWPW